MMFERAPGRARQRYLDRQAKLQEERLQVELDLLDLELLYLDLGCQALVERESRKEES